MVVELAVLEATAPPMMLPLEVAGEPARRPALGAPLGEYVILVGEQVAAKSPLLLMLCVF